MSDKEKVIKGLHDIGDFIADRVGFEQAKNSLHTIDEAVSMLKNQEERLRKLQKDKDKLCLEVSEWKHKYHDRPLKEQEADTSKYQYKYDHTDCIWYHSDEESRCPSSCSQYRDGWNDAMDYIFKDGKGYQPYTRKEGR
jgi:hypothetical protein